MSAAISTIETSTDTSPDALATITTGLEPSSVARLEALFVPFLTKAKEWEARAKAIVVTDEKDTRTMKLARESRLGLRDIRVAVEHARKAAKADALSFGKAVDGFANAIKGTIEPIEARLLHEETFAQRAEDARKSALAAARAGALRAYGADTSVYASLGEMSEDAWEALLDSVRLAHEAKLEAAKQAEAVRIEAERLAAEARAAAKATAAKAEAERLERERLQLEENARLQREKAELESAARLEREAAAEAARVAKAEADRVADELAEKARVEREAAEAEIRKARVEADRVARELAEANQKAIAAARAEREAADAEVARVEAELAAAKAADVARLAAEADAAKPTKAKYALLVAALNKIAAWGDDLAAADEPHAAAKAREALEAVGLGR